MEPLAASQSTERSLGASPGPRPEDDRLFRAVFESSGAAILIADDEGRYTDANPAAEALFGLPTGSLIGRRIADFAEPGFDFETSWREFRDGGSARGRFRIARPDGAIRSVEFSAVVGVLPGRHLSVLQDVTDREEAERMARSVLDSLSSHIAVVDESGSIIAVNRAWRAFAAEAGATETTGEGSNYIRVCESVGGEEAGHAAAFAEEIRAVLDGREGSGAREYLCETPGGARWFAGSVHPFQGQGPPRAVVVHEDISGWKSAEEARRRNETLFARIFRHSPIGLVLASIEPLGRLRMVSPAFCRMLGFTEEELLAGYCHTVTDETFVEEEIRHSRALIRGEIPFYRMEKRYLHKSGDLVWGRLHVTTLDDETGRRAYLLGMVEDITEARRAEEELARSAERTEALSRRLLRAQEDERRRIARELHDEIGQALTALKINIEEAGHGGPDVNNRLTESLSIVDGALRQVRGMALDLRPAILDDLGLREALEWYAGRQAQRTGLEGRVVADPAEIRAHPEVETACFRIAQEALTNVARHARATRFSVELIQHARGIQMVIRDDGVGFDPEAALRSGAQGFSSGLAGMRERAELIGGRIVFVSEPGGGSEVQAELPLEPSVGGVRSETKGGPWARSAS